MCVCVPSSLYRPVDMPARRDRVIKSPRLAAMGVATLSGLMPIFLDAIITPIMMSPGGVSVNQRQIRGPTAAVHRRDICVIVDVPSSREAIKAVATLEAHSSTAWSSLSCPSGIQLKITAAMEARNPTTVAWT